MAQGQARPRRVVGRRLRARGPRRDRAAGHHRPATAAGHLRGRQRRRRPPQGGAVLGRPRPGRRSPHHGRRGRRGRLARRRRGGPPPGLPARPRAAGGARGRRRVRPPRHLAPGSGATREVRAAQPVEALGPATPAERGRQRPRGRARAGARCVRSPPARVVAIRPLCGNRRAVLPQCLRTVAAARGAVGGGVRGRPCVRRGGDHDHPRQGRGDRGVLTPPRAADPARRAGRPRQRRRGGAGAA